eukprot:3593347-Prymnesium_polylepis.1
MSHRRGTSAQVRPNALSVSPRTTTRSVSTEQSSRGEESVKRRRATMASSRTVEFIDGLDVGS